MDSFKLLLLGLGGLIFISTYIIKYKKRKDYEKHGIRVLGIVLEVKLFYDRSRQRQYYPIVKYALEDGTWMIEKYSDGSSPASFKKGEQVEVLYNRKEPSSYIIVNKNNHSDKLFLLIGVMAILLFLYHLIK